jgi:crotonobetainyl-CoA:carnitine CoA-transferase CaiB-like acyl-CoA transferase
MTTNGAAVTGPLAGLTVLELGRYIAAPYAGRMLADLGADVVKVEDPDGGDPMRHWEGGSRPYSPQFAAYNRGKRSVTVDLRDPVGAAAVRDLARGADVLLENFRPGVMARRGLSAESLLAENPRLIYCAISGFGAVGPYAARPSYDTVISAVSGMYSLLMPLDTPAPVGPAMSDLLSGLYAVQGVLAALHHRAGTGLGQIVDVTMLGSVLGFLGEAVTSTAETGDLIEPNTRQRRAQAYAAIAADDKAFVVHLSVPDKFWHGLCSAMDRPDWREDVRLATRQDRYDNYAVLEALIREQARTRSRPEWFKRFLEQDLPHAPLNTLLDLADDEQVQAMGLLESIPMAGDAPMVGAATPIRFSASPTPAAGAAPLLGADNGLLDRDER